VTLPPCLIFKGENLNSGWIPDETPAGWKFITSKKGWTSDLIGFEWLKAHFQPFVSKSTNLQWIAKPLSGCTTYSLQRSPHGSCRSHPAKLRADKLNPALTSFPPILQGRSRAGAKRRSHVSYLGILARHYYRTSLAFPHDTAHLPRQAICIVHNCQPSLVFVSTPPPR
jgi:hypothetical protein